MMMGVEVSGMPARSSAGQDEHGSVGGRPGTENRGSAAGAWALPLSLSVSGLAVLLVALGYAGARGGSSAGLPLFWAGQVLLLGAAAVVLVARNQSRIALTTAVLAYSAGQWLIRVAYAPARLEFADELQHHRSALDILQSGHLFPVNYSLPISADYPGLEAVAVGLTRTTGLTLHLSEVLTAGIAHVLGTAAVLVLVRALVADPRAVAAAALIYSFGSYATFSTFFAYQTLAFPIAVLVVARVLRPGRSRALGRELGLTAVLSALVVVTHHVTAVVLLVALLSIVLVQALRRQSRGVAARTAAATAVHAALLTAWTATAARDVLPYLGAPLATLASDLGGQRSGAQAASPGIGQPLVERALTSGAVLLPLVALSLAAVVAWRRKHHRVAALAAVAVGIQLLLVAARLVSSDGAELANRGFAFTALVTAVAVATVIAAVRDGRLSPVGHRPSRRPGKVEPLQLVLAAGLVVVGVGGITAGWPPRYERLPTYQVAGFESAMDKHTVEAATWVGSALGPGNRFAADFGNLTAVGTIGNQNPLSGEYADIFTRPTDRNAVVRAVQDNQVSFLLVDSRVTQQLPPPDRDSWYLTDSAQARYTTPLDPAVLKSLDQVLQTDRIFDDGVISIYDLEDSSYVQPAG
jgi:hypothetical protein